MHEGLHHAARRRRRTTLISSLVPWLLLLGVLYHTRTPARGDAWSRSTLADAVPARRATLLDVELGHGTEPAGDAQVTYRITGAGTSTGALTFITADDTLVHRISQPIAAGWSAEVQAASGSFVYLSVQNGSSVGSVTCAISIDGEPYKQITATGAFALASCRGSVP